MKKIAVLCLLLVALRASGDLVLVEQIVEQRQPPLTITMKVKGDKLRRDVTNNISIIYDYSTGESVRINYATKTFRRISVKEVQATLAGQQNSGRTPARQPKITDTGKSEKVDGHDAEIYTAATPAATYTYWVTKDYPDFAAVNEQMKKIRKLGEAVDKTHNVAPDDSQLDGIVIKSESLSAGGELTTIKLVSAKAQPVDDSEFQVPEGYTQINPPPAQPIPEGQ